MSKDRHCDCVFLELCNICCDKAEHVFNSQTDECLLFSNEDVENAMDKMKSGKAPDEYGLSAEHFKPDRQCLTPIITNIFNQTMKEKSVPASFKTGIITPVLKKVKDAKRLENYRGRTVSGSFSKLFEYTLLCKLNPDQSCQQFGFTEGLSPIMAGPLVSEAKAEAQHMGTKGLYLATLDSQKAFNVVHKIILFDKLSAKGVHKDIWLIVKNL